MPIYTAVVPVSFFNFIPCTHIVRTYIPLFRRFFCNQKVKVYNVCDWLETNVSSGSEISIIRHDLVAYEMRAELVQPPRMLIICIRD